MKKITFLITSLTLTFSSFAQADAIDTENASSETIKDTSYWKKDGSLAINFNNTSLTNWSAGGANSVALGFILTLSAKYEKGKNNWVSNLTWQAGMARVGDKNQLLKKSDDQLIVFSKYRRNIKPLWGFAAFSELRTQVLSNPNYISNPDSLSLKKEIKSKNYKSAFMAPGYLTTSIGWEYNKGKDFYFHASPLAGRGIFVLDDSLSTLGLYGLDKNQRVMFQLGSLVRSGFKTKVMENVTFASNLTLFTPYENWGNIDVTWETLTTFKINKFLTTTFSTHLLYYDKARPKIVKETVGGVATDVAKHGVQFKQVLNIGFLAKF